MSGETPHRYGVQLGDALFGPFNTLDAAEAWSKGHYRTIWSVWVWQAPGAPWPPPRIDHR